MNYHRIFHLTVSLFVFVLISPICTAVSIAAYFAPVLFGTVDVRFSLTIDSLVANMKAEVSALQSAFKAFFERSLAHDHFSAGQFGADRMTSS